MKTRRRTLRTSTQKSRARRCPQIFVVCSSTMGGRIFRPAVFRSFHSKPRNSLCVRVENIDLETAKIQMLAEPRHASFLRDDQTRDSREIIGFNFHIEQAFNLSNLSSAQHFVS